MHRATANEKHVPYHYHDHFTPLPFHTSATVNDTTTRTCEAKRLLKDQVDVEAVDVDHLLGDLVAH